MLHWMGKGAKPLGLVSSPERDFALFDTGARPRAFRPPAPVGVGEAGRRAAFVCARTAVGYNWGDVPSTTTGAMETTLIAA